MKYLSLIFLLAFMTSCENLSEVHTILKPKDAKHANEQSLTRIKEQLDQRMQQAGYPNSIIEISDQADAISVKSKVNVESEAAFNRYRTLFGSNTLELWDTYRVNDPEISAFIDSLPEIEGFVSHKAFGLGMLSLETVGVCQDKSQLMTISDLLQKGAAQHPNLKLVWSENQQDVYEGEPSYYLTMVNTRGKDKAPVNQTFITDINSSVSSYTNEPEIFFNLNPEGTKVWAAMTKKAALNDNRSIAIMINDRVYSVPRVMSEIPSGSCVINGNFTLTETEKLAQRIKVGKLIFPLKIESEEVIQKNSN